MRNLAAVSLPLDSLDSAKANPLRGKAFAEAALKFANDYPIGQSLSYEKFDLWLMAIGLIPSVAFPPGTPKNSDAWMAHCYRRNQARYSINKAASHPRMADVGKPAYSIVARGGSQLVVESVYNAVANNDAAKKVASLVKTKRDQLGYLLQSADWNVLPAHQKAIAHSLSWDIRNFEQLINMQADFLNSKFQNFQKEVELAIADKTISPSNGGIHRLLANDDEN